MKKWKKNQTIVFYYFNINQNLYLQKKKKRRRRQNCNKPLAPSFWYISICRFFRPANLPPSPPPPPQVLVHFLYRRRRHFKIKIWSIWLDNRAKTSMSLDDFHFLIKNTQVVHAAVTRPSPLDEPMKLRAKNQTNFLPRGEMLNWTHWSSLFFWKLVRLWSESIVTRAWPLFFLFFLLMLMCQIFPNYNFS